jgi:hypothetical protein
MSSNKVVRVTYCCDDVFCVPKNINLEDKTQVENWGVKWNRLYITLTNGKELTIESRGWANDVDYKYPSGDPEILETDEVCCIDEDDEAFDEVDIGIPNTCGEPGSLNFLFGIPISIAKISDEISDDEQEEDEK